MYLVLIFVIVAGTAWLAITRLSAGPAPRAHRAELSSGGPDVSSVDQDTDSDASIEGFKAELKYVPVPELDGAQITLFYDGRDGPGREVVLRQILLGRQDFYLDCWWPARNDSRLFSARRVDRIVDAAGNIHDRAVLWVMRSGAAGAAFGDSQGWRLPKEGGRA